VDQQTSHINLPHPPALSPAASSPRFTRVSPRGGFPLAAQSYEAAVGASFNGGFQGCSSVAPGLPLLLRAFGRALRGFLDLFLRGCVK